MNCSFDKEICDWIYKDVNTIHLSKFTSINLLQKLLRKYSLEYFEDNLNNNNLNTLLNRQVLLVKYILDNTNIGPKNCSNINLPMLAAESGLTDVFILLTHKGFTWFSKNNWTFDSAVENGRIDIVKYMLSICTKEKQLEFISHSDYYSLYWSFRYGYYKLFIYLCSIIDISQQELTLIIPHLDGNQTYKSYIHLLHHFLNCTSLNSSIYDPNIIFLALSYC